MLVMENIVQKEGERQRMYNLQDLTGKDSCKHLLERKR